MCTFYTINKERSSCSQPALVSELNFMNASSKLNEKLDTTFSKQKSRFLAWGGSKRNQGGIAGYGTQLSMNWNIVQPEKIYKMEFPLYHGTEDTISWLNICNQFFNSQNIWGWNKFFLFLLVGNLWLVHITENLCL